VLLGRTVTFFFKHFKKLFVLSLVMYLVYLVLIRAGSTFDIETYDQLISDELGNNEVLNTALLTGILIGSGGSSETPVSSFAAFLIFVVGGFLYSTAEINILITSGLERTLFVSGWVALGLISVYWIANSLMSIYAVTLPDIYPMQALRSTKEVVKGRRWSVFIKIFMLGVFLLLFAGSMLFISVAAFPSAAVYVYDVLAIFVLLFAHIYLFKLYRSLL
jgi:hypothetical protein